MSCNACCSVPSLLGGDLGRRLCEWSQTTKPSCVCNSLISFLWPPHYLTLIFAFMDSVLLFWASQNLFGSWRICMYFLTHCCNKNIQTDIHKNRFFMIYGKHYANYIACGFSFKRILWLQIFKEKMSLFATYPSKRIF